MLALYLGVFLVGGGVVAVQAFAGHDTDATGHELVHAAHEPPPWALLLSLRFWSFGAMAFGLTGALFTAFGLLGAAAAGILSTLAGLSSGFFAATVLKRMTTAGPTSQVLPAEVVGRIGRVIVPAEAGASGKVRVELRGQIRDYVMTADTPLERDETVVVVDFDGHTARVAKAGKDLA